MAVPRWEPQSELSEREQKVMKRLGRVKKLFGFLREQRSVLFDEAFQEELAAAYRQTGAGSTAVAPAMMAMVVLLQAYTGASDAEAVELSAMDKRWQLVLGNLGSDEPAFSQGALQAFRNRLIEHKLDERLLARSREIASQTGGYDPKKLPKALEVAMDSVPFEGAGRVEDTINLMAHAARKILECSAAELGRPFRELANEAGIPLLLAPSVKAGLDVNWFKPGAHEAALQELCSQIGSLSQWLVDDAIPRVTSPLLPYIEALVRVQEQDLEAKKGKMEIREGVAINRRISIEDPQMRHGRKSQSHVINGYKRHVSVEMGTGLIVAAAVTPANQAEHVAAEAMNQDLENQGLRIQSLSIDLGYLASPLVEHILKRGGEVICRARPLHRRDGRFSKLDFKVNLRTRTAECPAGEVQRLDLGKTTKFGGCAQCHLRKQCTQSKTGRSLHIARDEPLQRRLRRQQDTRLGRHSLRKRVVVEHRQAHLVAKQGHRARYLGVRKNVFDTRRHAAVLNLETIQLAEISSSNQ
jgi:hypothetical protein